MSLPDTPSMPLALYAAQLEDFISENLPGDYVMELGVGFNPHEPNITFHGRGELKDLKDNGKLIVFEDHPECL